MGPLLIADNDPIEVSVMRLGLRKAGFEVVTTCDGDDAIAQLTRESFSLVILNVNMLGSDGLDVWTRLRQHLRLPVILLSERDAEDAALRGLEMGADDYLLKPFDSRALVARVHALLRRCGLSPTISAGNIVLDRKGLRLNVAGARFQLSRRETSLLSALLSNAGRYVDTETLMTEIWGQIGTSERKALKQMIYRLRRKLSGNATASALLQTSRGGGYGWHIERSDDAETH